MGKKREKKFVRMKDGTEPKHSNGKEHTDNGKEIAGERTTTREREKTTTTHRNMFGQKAEVMKNQQQNTVQSHSAKL